MVMSCAIDLIVELVKVHYTILNVINHELRATLSSTCTVQPNFLATLSLSESYNIWYTFLSECLVNSEERAAEMKEGKSNQILPAQTQIKQ
jgi:hypothetical protein